MIQDLLILLLIMKKKNLENEIKNILDWVEQNANASQEAYDNKRKGLDQMWKPITQRAYEEENKDSLKPKKK